MKIPKAGDKLRVLRPMYTMAHVSYEKGDILELVETTDQAPFGYKSGVCNWVVKCKHFTPPDKRCVWSTIWHMLDEGCVEILVTPFEQSLKEVEKRARADARTEVEAIIDGNPDAILDEAEADERVGYSDEYTLILDPEIKRVYYTAYINEFTKGQS